MVNRKLVNEIWGHDSILNMSAKNHFPMSGLPKYTNHENLKPHSHYPLRFDQVIQTMLFSRHLQY